MFRMNVMYSNNKRDIMLKSANGMLIIACSLYAEYPYWSIVEGPDGVNVSKV